MTTTETAVDCTTLAIEQVAEIIAGLAVFQSECNTAHPSESAARERIYKSYYRVKEQDVDPPFAIIFESAGTRWDRLADGTQTPKGEVFLHLGMRMQSDDDPEGEERRFNNFHGQISQAISQYNGAGYRLLTTITDPPSRTHPKDQGSTTPIWEVGYTVEWSAF